MVENYSAKIIASSRELEKRERIMYKDTGACTRLDEATKSGNLKITPVLWLTVAVHNEKAKDRPDYEQYIIVDKDGERYLTGSQSLYRSFMDIANEMGDEEFSIEVYRLPSKNYSGKEFLTCSLV